MKNYKKPKGKDDHKYTIYHYGDMTMYYRFGYLHRDKGAAYIDRGVNRKIYYRYGKIHRNDGPADIIEGEFADFYWNGERYDFNEWINKTDVAEDKKAHLILLYG